MLTQTFHPSDLNHFQTFREKWFTGRRELKTLRELPKHVYKRTKGDFYYSRFQFTWILCTLPFRVFYALFLRSVSFSLKAQSVEHVIDSAIRQLYWGRKYLVPSSNTYAPSARYLTEFSPIQKEAPIDPTIWKHLTKLFDRINFNLGESGLCSGGVNWFNYLVLLGQDKHLPIMLKCCDSREYLMAIAQLFKEGQPIQAALLQSLYGIDCPLLRVRETHYTLPKEHLMPASLYHLQDGLYHVRIPGVHSLSLLKSKGEWLVYDPNYGLLDLEDATSLIMLIKNYAVVGESHPLLFSLQKLKKEGFIQSIFSRVFR